MGCKCIKPKVNTEDEIESETKKDKNHCDSTSNDFITTINQNQSQSSRLNQKNKILKFKENNQNSNILDYNDSKISENNINDNNNNLKNFPKFDNIENQNESEMNENLLPEDDYSKYIFKNINQLRTNPKFLIPIIEESKSKITIDKYNRLIYKSKVKVALSKGKSAFDEAILLLNNTEPMNELIFNPKMCVPLPSNELDIQNKNYLKEKINEMVVQNIIIRTYWRDIIKDAETSFILMIVDDTGNKSGMKRKDILDPKMKYIGISSVMIGKSFVCYLTFSDRLNDDFF